MSLTKDDPRHGTQTGYLRLGCRCVRCRRSNADAGQAGRRSRYQREPSVHNDSTYHNWGCSCDTCLAAHRDHMARYAVVRRRRRIAEALASSGVPEDARSG